MIIESITKRGSSRVLITFDSGEKVTLAYEIVMKMGLRKDMQFSESQLESLLKQNESYTIKQQALRYLTRRIHSESELKNKLIRKGFKVEPVTEIINSLKDSGYLNDSTFAVNFIEEKKNRYSWGNKLISAALRKKGISREIIKESLQIVPAEPAIEKAMELLVKRYRTRTLEEIDSLKLKMYTFLISKGYDYDLSERAVEDYIGLRNSGKE